MSFARSAQSLPRRGAFALFLLTLLSLPAFAQTDDGDPLIDARRLGVMIDQSEAALHAIAPTFPAVQSRDDGDGDAYAELVSAVRRYDATVAQACRARLVGPRFCGTPYDPSWLSTPPSDLRAAIDEAGDRITPFWNALCAQARKATGDQAFCSLE
jgi:hypothetical protein